MKKHIFWTIALVLIGNIINLVVKHQDFNLPQAIIWVFGTIWFILFLVYGLVPVVVNLLEERKC